MKQVFAVAFAFGLVAAPAAFAADQKAAEQKPQPVQMSDAQLDNVSAGALINAFVIDVVDINNNQVAVSVPVSASVAASVLGGPTGAVSLQQPGNINQPR